MCRFLGEFSFDQQLSFFEQFRVLNELSKPGGPDSTGFWEDNYCRMGFNRLAILDTSENGNQPLLSPDGNYVIVFNGEIYNYQGLIKKFGIDRSKLRSSSDSEVIAHLVEIIPVHELPALLNGMFAISVWDKRKQYLWLMRDFAGIKPLFYGLTSHGVVFASQFDQVIKHSWIKGKVNVAPEGLFDYIRFGYMHAPNTIYTSVFQLMPGEIILFDAESGIREKRFFKRFFNNSYSANSVIDTDPQHPKYLFKLLMDVIKDHLVSDVPLGSFLSGGIDSPIVTAIGGLLDPSVCSFTMGLNDRQLNESKIASQYARHRHIKNVSKEFTTRDLIQINDKHFNAYPEPFGDYSSLPTFLITQEASKSFKVMLSGDGGDELFWGYPRFINVMNHSRWFLLPIAFRTILAKGYRLSGKRLSYAVESYNSIGDWMMDQHSHNNSDFLKNVCYNFSNSTSIQKAYEFFGTNKSELLLYMRKCEFYAHLQRVLIKVDRASMANGLEVRVPFLDERVIQFSQSINPTLGINHRITKNILKKLMEQLYPSEIINQKKMGFSVPIKGWMLGALREEVMDLLIGTSMFGEEFFDNKKLKDHFYHFFKTGEGNEWGIWIFYALQKWAHLINR